TATAVDEAFALGRIYQARGQREAAVKQYEQAVTTALTDPPRLARALGHLEEACEDPRALRAFCDRLRSEHPGVAGFPFSQWLLEPAAARSGSQLLFHDEFLGALSSDWVWHDPFEDCSFTVRNGLRIAAAN